MNLSIRSKLFGGFTIVLLLLVIISGVGLWQIKSVEQGYRSMIEDRVPKIILAEEIGISVEKQAKHLRGYLLLGEEKYLENIAQESAEFTEKSAQLRSMFRDPVNLGLLDEIDKLFSEYDKYAKEAIQQKKGADSEYLMVVKNQTAPIAAAITEKTNLLIQNQQDKMKQVSDSLAATVNDVQVTILIISIVAVVVGIVIAWIVSMLISRPVTQLSAAADLIADGDLTGEDLQIKRKDEIGRLAASFNSMKGNLITLITGVNGSAIQVAGVAEELSASSGQVAKTTSEVAVTIQQVAQNAESTAQGSLDSSRGMQESSIGIQRIAESAQIVAETTGDTLKATEEGNKAVSETMTQINTIKQVVDEAMVLVEKLNQQSEQIGKITGAITDITEQTNLLALNAAIEAARAGEHGRGFAVVADEVRKLAEQSKESASQITQLIVMVQQDTSSVTEAMKAGAREVESGVKLMETVGSTFQSIRASVQNVSEQMQEISAAAEEMSASTEQVMASVEQMADMSNEASSSIQVVSAATQEQLASIEEINTVASDMSKMAVDLQDMLNKFKVE